MTDSYIIFTLKMESVSKNTIFGLKMMVKSGLEKIFLKFLHVGDYFFLLYKSVQNHKFSNKNKPFSAWKDVLGVNQCSEFSKLFFSGKSLSTKINNEYGWRRQCTFGSWAGWNSWKKNNMKSLWFPKCIILQVFTMMTSLTTLK